MSEKPPSEPTPPEPHVYHWLGNGWFCLRCDVQIRNKDCPYNMTDNDPSGVTE